MFQINSVNGTISYPRSKKKRDILQNDSRQNKAVMYLPINQGAKNIR